MSGGRRTVAAVLATGLWILAIGDLAAQGEQRSVLTLYGQRRESALALILDPLLQDLLEQRVPGVDYYNEFIDASRFAEPDFQHALRGFLKHKYAGRRFDVVIAASSVALEFVKANQDALFAGVPLVFHTTPSFEPEPRAAAVRTPHSTGLASTTDLARTLTMVAQLQPETKQVFVVTGSAPLDARYESLARRQFRGFDGRFQFTYWSGLPMKELLERVADLPPNSVLYPLMITQDRSGQRYRPFEQNERIAVAANVPVYAWGAPQMGSGVVGGSLNNPARLAAPLAEVVVRVLAGENPDNIPVATVDLNVTEVDWRQLRRWGIADARVPVGTTVRFREPSVWVRYRPYVAGTVILFILQTALIGTLLVQRVRRRRVERALRESEGALRDSNRQNHDLAGRLITAQEAERARIARELHDDVCQRLAALSIVVGGFRRRLKHSRREGDVDEALAMVQRTTSGLSNDVRNLSHELHSSILQYAGLPAALTEHCADFGRRHHLDVRVDTADSAGALDTDIALCLFRVTQEALTNTARHAHAQVVHVRLARTVQGVELDVVDDGAGFDAARHNAPGLGLRSIGERVRFAKGSVSIESQPGCGTKVLVRIPLPQ